MKKRGFRGVKHTTFECTPDFKRFHESLYIRFQEGSTLRLVLSHSVFSYMVHNQLKSLTEIQIHCSTLNLGKTFCVIIKLAILLLKSGSQNWIFKPILESSRLSSFFLSRQHHFWFLFWLVRLLESSTRFEVASSGNRQSSRISSFLSFAIFPRPSNRWVLESSAARVKGARNHLPFAEDERAKEGRGRKGRTPWFHEHSVSSSDRVSFEMYGSEELQVSI